MKFKIIRTLPALIILSGFLVVSCSSGSIIDYPELYKQQVWDWEDRLIEDPNDFEALKQLGMYYSQIKEHETARLHIDKALNMQPDDPALILYKGINLEFFNKQDEALEYYKKYSEVPEDSPFREVLEGRFLWAKRQQGYSDVKLMIQQEDQLSIAEVSPNTMAVFPLIYQGINPDYVPLSRGFSEMVSIDLAKIPRLTILERIRIQAVLDELKFAQSGYVDQSTAPRSGKILRAGTIVSGDYDITDDGKFKINLGSWDTQTTERKSWVNKSGSLDEFFILQKEVVFAFLEKNGINLTQQERESIAYIQTQNLESFLAYSKGLLLEDAGKFNEASIQYQRASQIDPQFQIAADKFKASGLMSKSSGSKEDMVDVLKTNYAAVKNETINIIENRIQSMVTNIVSSFIQGIDFRSLTENESFLNLFIDVLPLPPLPPTGQ